MIGGDRESIQCDQRHQLFSSSMLMLQFHAYKNTLSFASSGGLSIFPPCELPIKVILVKGAELYCQIIDVIVSTDGMIDA
jgi:hypothetical protein